MKVNDYIIFQAADPITYIWKITGIYHGEIGQESVVGLESVTFTNAWAGHEVKEMLAPWALVRDHVYTRSPNNGAIQGAETEAARSPAIAATKGVRHDV